MKGTIRKIVDGVKKEASQLNEILHTDVKDTVLWKKLNTDVMDLAADWYVNNVGTLQRNDDIEVIEPKAGEVHPAFDANEDGSLTDAAQKWFEKMTGAVPLPEAKYGTAAKVIGGLAGAAVGLATFGLAGNALAADNLWGGPDAPDPVMSDPVLKDLVTYVQDNDVALLGFAADAKVGPNSEWPLAVQLVPPEHGNNQDVRKGVVYQTRDLLNALGIQHAMKNNPELVDLGVDMMVMDYVKRTNPNKLDDVGGRDNIVVKMPNSIISDVKIVDDNGNPENIPGVTGVRNGHFIWHPGKTLRLPRILVEQINQQYLQSRVDGTAQPVNLGSCDIGFYSRGHDDNGIILCEPLPTPGQQGVVGGMCDKGEYARGVNPDGTPTCEKLPEDKTEVKGGLCEEGEFAKGVLPNGEPVCVPFPTNGNGHKNGDGDKDPSGSPTKNGTGRSWRAFNVDGLGANVRLDFVDQMWKSEIETNDADGTPIKSQETAHSSDLSGKAAIFYMFHPNFGVGAEYEGSTINGKEEGSANQIRLDFIMDLEQGGMLRAGYVPWGTSEVSRNDGDLDINRESNFTGIEARYVSPAFWKNDPQRTGFAVLDYSNLQGDSEATVGFDVPGVSIPDQKKEGSFKSSEFKASANVLFVPTKFGPLGIEAMYGKSSMETDEGKQDVTTFGVGPSMRIPIKSLDANVDIGAMYNWSEQDPHDDSVESSKSEGAGIYIRFGGDTPLY